MLEMAERVRGVRGHASAAPFVVAVGCALVLVLTGCGRSSGTAAAAARPLGSSYTLMQMNLCLSGLAGCYGKVEYPAGVQEAVARIREAHPDAVTFNEACGNDVALIAHRTGYHLRFSRVIYYGKPLPCIRPGGRGLFGDAVLTKAAIDSADSRPFPAQAGPERRDWLCVSTRAGVEVCTAHLASPELDEAAANAPQCAELGALLAVGRLPAPSSSGATSTGAPPARPTASGPAPTAPAARTPGVSRSTGRTRSALPRRGWCRRYIPTTTSCWSARASRPEPTSAATLVGDCPDVGDNESEQVFDRGQAGFLQGLRGHRL